MNAFVSGKLGMKVLRLPSGLHDMCSWLWLLKQPTQKQSGDGHNLVLGLPTVRDAVLLQTHAAWRCMVLGGIGPVLKRPNPPIFNRTA